MMGMNSNKKEYKKWEKSERSGDNSKTMEVEEIENGFLVRITHDAYGKEYKHECKKWYSKTNPLEKLDPVAEDNDLMKAIDKFNEAF